MRRRDVSFAESVVRRSPHATFGHTLLGHLVAVKHSVAMCVATHLTHRRRTPNFDQGRIAASSCRHSLGDHQEIIMRIASFVPLIALSLAGPYSPLRC